MKSKDHHIQCRKGTYYIVYKGVRKSLKTKEVMVARMRRDELMRQIDFKGVSEFTKEVPKFSEVCSQWIAYKSTKKLREETIYKFTLLVENTLSVADFYYKPVDKIDDLMIEDWWGTLRCKPQTINHYLTIVSNIFKFARKRKYISVSPMDIVERPKIKERTLPDPFTKGEMDTIIGASDHYQDLIITKFFTGMRTSEICGLTKSAVDLDRGVIIVRQRLLQGVVAPCKNQYSNREIKMLPDVRKAVMRAMLRSGCEYVFVNEQNKSIHSSTLNDCVWKNLLLKLNIRYRPIKNTRHTFISIGVASSIDLMYLAQTVGHSSTAMIHKHYAGYMPKDDNFDKLSTVLSQGDDSQPKLLEKIS